MKGKLSAYEIFLRLISIDSVTKEVDASGVISKECYDLWLNTRPSTLKQPEESFRRALTAHLCGADGRQHFELEVENAIIRLLRSITSWPCFEGLDVNIGSQGFRAQGYHERLLAGKSPRSHRRAERRRERAKEARRRAAAAATVATADVDKSSSGHFNLDYQEPPPSPPPLISFLEGSFASNTMDDNGAQLQLQHPGFFEFTAYQDQRNNKVGLLEGEGEGDDYLMYDFLPSPVSNSKCDGAAFVSSDIGAAETLLFDSSNKRLFPKCRFPGLQHEQPHGSQTFAPQHQNHRVDMVNDSWIPNSEEFILLTSITTDLPSTMTFSSQQEEDTQTQHKRMRLQHEEQHSKALLRRITNFLSPKSFRMIFETSVLDQEQKPMETSTVSGKDASSGVPKSYGFAKIARTATDDLLIPFSRHLPSSRPLLDLLDQFMVHKASFSMSLIHPEHESETGTFFPSKLIGASTISTRSGLFLFNDENHRRIMHGDLIGRSVCEVPRSKLASLGLTISHLDTFFNRGSGWFHLKTKKLQYHEHDRMVLRVHYQRDTASDKVYLYIQDVSDFVRTQLLP